MVHKKIRIPKESANEILFALGKLKNAIEFEDLTKNDIEAKKSFGDMIKRCDEMKKKIDDFIQICKEFQVPLNINNTFYDLNSRLSLDMQNRDKKLGLTYFDLVESEIMKNSRKISDLVDSHEQMRENLILLIEKKHVLEKASELIRDSLPLGNFSESGADEDGFLASINSNLVLMAGTVPTEYEMKLKRMIFRISRGNATTTFYNLYIDKDEYIYTSTVRQRGFSIANITNQNQIVHNVELFNNMNNEKKIFSVVFPGSSENILLKKILKACEIFQASRYSVPKSSKIKDELDTLNADIRVKKSMLQSIERTLSDLLRDLNKFQDINGYKYLIYKIYFEQQRLIYTNLGKCILRENFVDGRVWIPQNKLELIEQTLNNLFKGKENKINASLSDIENEHHANPPTLIITNEFTSIPQMIVDTYGTPRYKEINPGYFTIITFPFLFGVMFGDIGHSLFLILLSVFLFIKNNTLSKSSNPMIQILAQSRYFILLMGFFALYCGILYNDFLSVPIYFNSCYENLRNSSLPINKIEGCTYKLGLDPVWYISNNELTFVNSFKMKFSVIIGVFQMIIGIILRGLNSIYENNLVDFFFVFIPQLIFMLILFGYMDALIFLKWSVNYEIEDKRAPDIKSILMNIVLKFGQLPPPPGKDIDWELYGDRNLFEKLHLGILIVAIVCIVVMLVPTIFLNYRKAKINYLRANRINANNVDEANENLIQINTDANQEKQEPLISDFVVASIIETIEFALGAVSNTASYLRLWALSLAHSQLSKVFFEYSIGLLSRRIDNPIGDGFLLTWVFVIYGGVIFGVLLCMDSMECFLHTLRLHWVEFQNKFFRADGHKFHPFCFEINIEESQEEFV